MNRIVSAGTLLALRVVAPACAAGEVMAVSASAQTYQYSYSTADPYQTSGSFTISGAPGAYRLAAFSGKIGGVAYDTSSVGIAPGSRDTIYLGGLLGGVDYYANGTNDFTESVAFAPGADSFTDFFQYSTVGSQTAMGVAVSFALAGAVVPSYFYAFAGDDSAQTSGMFTITGGPGAYRLAAFSGTVGGVTYDTSMVGIASGSEGAIYLGALLNGVDYYANGTNDFTESGAFIPGNGAFTDFFQYSRIGLHNAAGVAVSFTPISGVPEPATWAMTITGFGAVGAALRRRRHLAARLA